MAANELTDFLVGVQKEVSKRGQTMQSKRADHDMIIQARQGLMAMSS